MLILAFFLLRGLENLATGFSAPEAFLYVAIFSQKLIIFSLVLKGILYSKINFPKSSFSILALMGMFLLLSCATFFWGVSDFRYEIQRELGRLITYFLVVAALYLNIKTQAELKRMFRGWLIVLAVQGVVAFFPNILFGEVIRVGGTFLPAVVLLFYLLSSRFPLPRYYPIIFGVLFFFALVNLIEVPIRRQIFTFVVSFFLVVFWNMQRKTFKYCIGLMALALLLVVNMNTTDLEYRYNQTLEFADGFNSGMNGRETLWVYAMQHVNEAPWLGNGYGINEELLGQNRNSEAFRVHNTYLKAWLELGLVGLIIYLVLFLLLCHRSYVIFAGFSKDGELFLAAAYFGLFTVFLTDFFVSFFGYSGYLDKGFWIYVALVLCGLRIQGRRGKKFG